MASPPEGMYVRVTVRGTNIELRGYVRDIETLTAVAQSMEPLGAMVVASPVPQEETGDEHQE